MISYQPSLYYKVLYQISQSILNGDTGYSLESRIDTYVKKHKLVNHLEKIKEMTNLFNEKNSQFIFLNAVKIKNVCAVNIYLKKYKNSFRLTDLMIAVINRDVKKVELLGTKEELEKKDCFGNSPLMWAVIFSYEDIVRKLLNLGADIDTKDREGKTPLIYTVKEGDMKMLNLLLQLKADVNAKDFRNNSALLWAYYQERINFISTLIYHKADTNISIYGVSLVEYLKFKEKDQIFLQIS